jgi:hypothetical protein
MRKYGLKALIWRGFKIKTTNSDHAFGYATNQLPGPRVEEFQVAAGGFIARMWELLRTRMPKNPKKIDYREQEKYDPFCKCVVFKKTKALFPG